MSVSFFFLIGIHEHGACTGMSGGQCGTLMERILGRMHRKNCSVFWDTHAPVLAVFFSAWRRTLLRSSSDQKRGGFTSLRYKHSCKFADVWHVWQAACLLTCVYVETQLHVRLQGILIPVLRGNLPHSVHDCIFLGTEWLVQEHRHLILGRLGPQTFSLGSAENACLRHAVALVWAAKGHSSDAYKGLTPTTWSCVRERMTQNRVNAKCILFVSVGWLCLFARLICFYQPRISAELHFTSWEMHTCMSSNDHSQCSEKRFGMSQIRSNQKQHASEESA